MASLLAHARSMARYNAWMNRKLYGCCGSIPDAERKRDVGAFFKSIHGTLNHLLVGDRIWMGRFTGKPFAVPSLATELYADFGELRREREATDASISDWAARLTEEALDGTLTYRTIVNPQTVSTPMWISVAHFFNHQTHHRGQLTTLLMQRGVDPGVTDLLWMHLQEPAAER